jgi:hypothetical protein
VGVQNLKKKHFSKGASFFGHAEVKHRKMGRVWGEEKADYSENHKVYV